VIRILVVDDSPLVRKLFGRVLGEEPDFEVRFARNGIDALAQLDEYRPDVITLDVQMPEMGGLECLDRIMVQRPSPVLMVSTVTEEGAEATLNALELGAIDFVTKPSGAVSLRIDEFAPILKSKIRAAASAKVPASRRLLERVQLKAGGVAPRGRKLAETADGPVEPAEGHGIVLVGTSTGGPPALEALLVPLPASFPWPIVVAQHMPAGFTGPLARRLNGICSLQVVETASPLPLEAGTVYIARGDADIVLSRRAAGLVVMAAPGKPEYPWHPSVERLVRSAMPHLPATQIIGVLMTGMGNDGALAMADLHASGGKTIAESEDTAIVWGMPGELARAGGATYVLPLQKIARRLQSMVPAHATGT
jgi:two-component system chemotaxis response regulator CheB